MTGLRTIWGVSLNRIATEFGPKFKEYALLQADKFIEEQNRQIRLQQAYDRITKMSKQKQMEFDFDK